MGGDARGTADEGEEDDVDPLRLSKVSVNKNPLVILVL